MKEIKNLKEMGFAIRSARRDVTMTQAQLCAKARVCGRWLIAWENGESEPPDASKILDSLRALALDFAIGPPGERPRPNQATLGALGPWRSSVTKTLNVLLDEEQVADLVETRIGATR